MDRGIGAGCGGIDGLLTLLDEHWEAVEADLAFKGIDLSDVWRGTLSFRRLAVLLRGLPQESLYKAALWDGMTPEDRKALPEPKGYGPWSREALQLARVGDALDWLVWSKTEDGAANRNRPQPYPRPGVESQTKARVPVTEAQRALWEQIRDNRGAVPNG